MNYLGGVAAAGGIALINALGALGGFVAPNVKALADASFGSSQAGRTAFFCVHHSARSLEFGSGGCVALSRSLPSFRNCIGPEVRGSY